MSSIPNFDPKTSEIQSPLIAGLTDAVSYVSSILGLKTEQLSDYPLEEIFIDDDDRFRIYQAPLGKKLWLENPTPVFKKNGNVVTPISGGFKVDYIGGSIAFDSVNENTADDVFTVSCLHAVGKSDLADNVGELKKTNADLAEKVGGIKDTTDILAPAMEDKVDGAYVEGGYLYLTSNNNVVVGPLGPFSGTGGGGGNNAKFYVKNASGWLSKTVAYNGTCPVVITWGSTDEDIETGNGTLTVRVNNAVKATLDVPQGDVTVDVGKYLSAGRNYVKVSISDVYENTRSVTYTITAADISIKSEFDSKVTYPAGQPINYTYTPVGNLDKTVHFVVDGSETKTDTVTTSNRQVSHSISGLDHGSHSLLVYFTAMIEEEEVKSNELYYDLVVIDPESKATIIASTFRDGSAVQYKSIKIPYTVYTPKEFNSPVTMYANNVEVATLTVDRTEQIWSYRPETVGPLTLAISSGGTIKMFTVDVSAADVDIKAESDSLALHMTSRGRSNNEDDPSIWEYGDVKAELKNFNFVSDGWILDENGDSALRVAGDARVEIPYKPFAKDFRTTGKTLEFEFATSNVLNYDAVLLSCMSGGRGFELTAQKATLRSAQSTVSTQYKEDEHVRIAFVCEKRSEHRLLYIYINGVMSGVVLYPTDDDFSQVNPVNITIGSNDCVIDIYNIRVYDNDLTRYQVLNNWIADTANADDMFSRYDHNNVYNEYGNITVNTLPNDLPYLVMKAPELPQYKGDKKTVSGYYVDPVNSSRSFTFDGAEANVQGTSSQYYPRKNYKLKFKNGFTMSDGKKATGFAIRNGDIATNVFTFKADVASSEGANNVELVRLYNDSCPYRTPAQKKNPAIRQGIDGFPMVIFWDNGEEVTFIGKYNFNNDKSSEDVFGFVSGDESWEVLNNTSNRVLWKSNDYDSKDDKGKYDWLNDFEGRYPDGYDNPTNLKKFSDWIVTTDTSAATNQSLSNPVTYDNIKYEIDSKEYRLAKFKAELGEYVELDSALFYYLFTELFLMVDSRAKNMFPSFLGEEAK